MCIYARSAETISKGAEFNMEAEMEKALARCKAKAVSVESSFADHGLYVLHHADVCVVNDIMIIMTRNRLCCHACLCMSPPCKALVRPAPKPGLRRTLPSTPPGADKVSKSPVPEQRSRSHRGKTQTADGGVAVEKQLEPKRLEDTFEAIAAESIQETLKVDTPAQQPKPPPSENVFGLQFKCSFGRLVSVYDLDSAKLMMENW